MHSPRSFLALKLLVVITLVINPTGAQYGGGGGGGGGSEGEYHPSANDYYNGGGSDERPKVQLGIRVRIPAFKFQLPRMNLPKVTISAKIRQPDKPRTINLPEINLDTSSRVAAPSGAENGYGGHPSGGSNYSQGYAASAPQQHYQPANYGSNYGHDQAGEISFTSEQDSYEQPHYQQSAGASYANREPRMPPAMQPGPTYGSTNIHPSYQAAYHQMQRQQQPINNRHPQEYHPREEAERGFDAPVYPQRRMWATRQS